MGTTYSGPGPSRRSPFPPTTYQGEVKSTSPQDRHKRLPTKLIDEILVTIFGYLDAHSVRRIRLVCKRWGTYDAAYYRKLSECSKRYHEVQPYVNKDVVHGVGLMGVGFVQGAGTLMAFTAAALLAPPYVVLPLWAAVEFSEIGREGFTTVVVRPVLNGVRKHREGLRLWREARPRKSVEDLGAERRDLERLGKWCHDLRGHRAVKREEVESMVVELETVLLMYELEDGVMLKVQRIREILMQCVLFNSKKEMITQFPEELFEVNGL